MLEISKVKPGSKILHKEKPCEIIKTTFSKIGRQGAVLRAKLLDLKTGNVFEETFRDSSKLTEIELNREKAQFLYKDKNLFHFMNINNYEQFSLDKKTLQNLTNFLIEGAEVQIIYYNNEPITIEMPIKMNFKVIESPPSTKGNTADGGNKKVIIETGLIVDVPLFIKEGDIIKINTQENIYVERVNE